MKKIFVSIGKAWQKAKNGIIRLAYRIWGTERIDPEPPKELPLHSLSPITDFESNEIFCDTLYWALKKRKEKDIRNIAITGPYGSGKSTFLKTFQEKYKDDTDLKFLNISLATFKAEKESVGAQPSSDDLLRLIELSILQQLFYFEKAQNIPDSRFKKINTLNPNKIWITVIFLTLFCLSLIHQLNPCLFSKLLLQKCGWPVPGWLHYSTLVIVVSLGFIMLFKSIRSLRNITLKSLKLNDTAEFEINESINKSILNHHLDEILYFFQVTDYAVVVIEDLDRFEQTEIFTKLRELNLLINNSKNISREIVFIYAVRDELFRGEKERTKFFDFLIPVIPVINSSNSGEKLLKIIMDNGFNISNDLVEDVALFIDDMRLLYNITNEYFLYSKKLDPKLNQNKLFAMMVYKNLYPDDFVDLGNGKGQLYSFFESKKTLIHESIGQLDSTISELKSEIGIIENLQLTDSIELRKLYLLEYLIELNDLVAIKLLNKEYKRNQIHQIAEKEELFTALIDRKAEYTTESYSYPTYRSITTKFEDLEKRVDSERTYYDRLALIDDFHNDKTETLRKEINDLERQKLQIKTQPIKALFQRQSSSVELENKKQQQLVSILLRNGYIDEHYHDYISIFYEGSLTKQDQEFLLNVKAQIPSECTYKLSKIDNLISKINPAEFDQSYILNYDLVDHLFKTNTYQTQKDGILRLLSNESESSISFVNGFIDVAVNKGKFIQSLTDCWPNYWKTISKNSILTRERVRLFLSLMLEHGEINAIAKQSDLKAYLEAQSDFFNLIDHQQKLFKIVETLNLKFKQLDIQVTRIEEMKFVEEGNYHSLNPEIIRSVIQSVGKYDEKTFNCQNYQALQVSECENLLDYIHSKINVYISQVYLKIPDNTEETETGLQKLMNNSSLETKNKVSLLQFTKTKIALLTSIPKVEDQTLLFIHSRVAPVWGNVIMYHQNIGGKTNLELIDFLNNDLYIPELTKSEIIIPKSFKLTNENKIAFINEMIQTNELNDSIYTSIIQSITGTISQLPAIETIGSSKVEICINLGKLSLTKENYSSLRMRNGNLHINLILKNKSTFLNHLSDFELQENEVHALLASNEFTSLDKTSIAQSIEQSIILSSEKLIVKCADLCISDSDFNIPDDTIRQILLHPKLSVPKSIRLFNSKNNLFSQESTHKLLEELGEPYSRIIVLGKRPIIPHNSDNLAFLTHLKTIGIIKDYKVNDKGIQVSTYRK